MIDDEVALLRGAGGAVRMPRDVVRVAGSDAATYLQGQISQDVDTVAVGEPAWSFVLEPQGQVVALFRISRIGDDEFVLDTDAGHGGALVARLERFRLRVDAAIETLDWQVVAVRAGTPDQLPDVSGAGLAADAGWPGVAGVDLLGPEIAVPDGVNAVSADALEVVRIESGVPRHGAEIDEATIPNQLPILSGAVSFTKGCFTGQELVARIDSRGNNVPRRLLGVRSVTPLEPGDILHLGEEEVATVTSAAVSPTAGSIGLAYVKRGVEPGVEVTNERLEGPATVSDLPLVG